MDTMFQVIKQLPNVITFNVNFLAIDSLSQFDFLVFFIQRLLNNFNLTNRIISISLNQYISFTSVIIYKTRIVTIFKALEHFNDMPGMLSNSRITQCGTLIGIF